MMPSAQQAVNLLKLPTAPEVPVAAVADGDAKTAKPTPASDPADDPSASVATGVTWNFAVAAFAAFGVVATNPIGQPALTADATSQTPKAPIAQVATTGAAAATPTGVTPTNNPVQTSQVAPALAGAINATPTSPQVQGAQDSANANGPATFAQVAANVGVPDKTAVPESTLRETANPESTSTANSTAATTALDAKPEAISAPRPAIESRAVAAVADVRSKGVAAAETSPSDNGPATTAPVDSTSSIRSNPFDDQDDDLDISDASGDGATDVATDRTPLEQKSRAESSNRPDESHTLSTVAEGLRDRIADQLSTLRETGRAEVQMNLHPPELGKIQVHLTMEDGNMRIQMTVQDDSVKRILDQQLEPLRVRFNELGVGIGQFDVRRDGGAPQGERDPEDIAAQALSRKRMPSTLAKAYGPTETSTSLLDIFA